MSGKRKYDFNKSKQRSKKAKYGGGGGGYAKLEAGMKGVLVSHDRNKEKSCRIDCFRILNHFADKYFGPENINNDDKKVDAKQVKNGDGDDAESESGDEDIISALSSEVKEIKDSVKVNKSEQRRFTVVKSGCNNLIFFRFNKEITPGPFLSKLVKTIFQNNQNKDNDFPSVKQVLRMHPVDFSCPAYLDNMCKNIPPFLEDKFKCEEFQDADKKEFTIEYKCRNNSHLSRQEVLEKLCTKMWESTCEWRYNCRSQSVSVIIDVLKTVCLVSVVKDYYHYKKYNIRELISSNATSKGLERKETSAFVAATSASNKNGNEKEIDESRNDKTDNPAMESKPDDESIKNQCLETTELGENQISVHETTVVDSGNINVTEPKPSVEEKVIDNNGSKVQ